MLMVNELFTGNNLADEYGIFFLLMNLQTGYN